MNDEVSRIYRYTFIGKASSKFFWTKVCIDTRCSCQCKLLQIPKVLCLRHAVVFFLSSKNAFRSYLMIFKCALAIWLRSLTVEISYDLCPALVNLRVSQRKLETVCRFMKCTVAKSFDNVNISEKSFKITMLTKFYP